jgi:hypothetical protein
MPDAPADKSPAELAPIEIGEVGLTLNEATDEEQEQQQPVRRSRLRRTLLIAVLVVAVVGAGFLGYEAYQIVTQKDAKLATPAQIGTLTLDNSEDAKSTADYLQTAIAAEIDMDNTIGAVYTEGANAGKDILLFGGTTLFWTPDNDLDAAFDMIADNEGAVTNLHDVPAGPLGGTMRCGTTKTDSGPLTVCGWADHGALAVALFNNRTEQEAAKLLPDIRKATETRS